MFYQWDEFVWVFVIRNEIRENDIKKPFFSDRIINILGFLDECQWVYDDHRSYKQK